jgi:hypothetical protein
MVQEQISLAPNDSWRNALFQLVAWKTHAEPWRSLKRA